MHDGTIEYRPRVVVGLVFADLFMVTAVVLAWLGYILGPEDQGAMDGFARLLFSVVSIRLFAWTFSAVFVGLGVLIARRTFRQEPTLVISGTGLTLPEGRTVGWEDVRSVHVTDNDHLVIEVGDDDPETDPVGRRRRFIVRLRLRPPPGQVAISPFLLGTDPAAIRTEIEQRRAVNATQIADGSSTQRTTPGSLS
jgi:hypothetical protein